VFVNGADGGSEDIGGRYTVEIARSAARALRRLDRHTQQRIGRSLDGLVRDPRPAGVRKLAGAGDDLWRIRVGDYRVVYEIRDDRLVVLVLRIGHRRDIYR